MKRIFFTATFCLTLSVGCINAESVFGNEEGPIPGISESTWVYMTLEQKKNARSEYYMEQQKKLEEKKGKPTFVRGVLPPQYLSVFAQCDAITETSSKDEIQKVIGVLETYKNSDEVRNFVESFAQETQPLNYEDLAAKGPEPIQRGSYWIVNIPGKIEDYLGKLKVLLSK